MFFINLLHNGIPHIYIHVYHINCISNLASTCPCLSGQLVMPISPFSLFLYLLINLYMQPTCAMSSVLYTWRRLLSKEDFQLQEGLNRKQRSIGKKKQWRSSSGKLLCIDGGGLCHKTTSELGKFGSGPTKSRSVRKHFCYRPLSEPESSGSVRIVGFDHRPLPDLWCNDYKNRAGLFTCYLLTPIYKSKILIEVSKKITSAFNLIHNTSLKVDN